MYSDVFWDLKIYMFLRRSLARAYKLHVHDFFSCRYIWGLTPPPPYQKAGYATADAVNEDLWLPIATAYDYLATA